MIRRFLQFLFLFLAFLWIWLSWSHGSTPERLLIEKLLNLGTREYFSGTLRLSGGDLDRRLSMRLDHLRAELKTEAGAVPLTLESLDSEASLLRLFTKEGLRLTFAGLRPADSRQPGVKGTLLIKLGKIPTTRLSARIEGLELSEIRWLNPDNLEGSTGILQGDLLAASSEEGSRFTLKITSPKGELQSRFFQGLLPYLPKLPETKKLGALAGNRQVVGFMEGSLEASLPASDRMKIFMHLVVPEYTMNLNLNVEIRVDKENAFLQLARWMGLIRIKNS